MNTTKPQPKRGTPDFQLLILTLLLVGFGLIMVFSSSSSLAVFNEKFNNDPLHFTKRQVAFAVLGTLVMFVAMNINYKKYKKLFIPVFFLTLMLLILVVIIGSATNGATSWFNLGKFGIQPTELAKIATIVYLAALITKKGERIRQWKGGFFPVLIIVGIVAGLIMLQPDLGSCFILVATSGLLIYAGGASLKHILGCISLVALGLVLTLGVGSLFNSGGDQEEASKNYKMGRIEAFMDPFHDESDTGYNLVQSLIAIGQGGVTGAGYGESVQKLHYLPNPYNDFIFSVIGEEFGFIGTAIFLLLYLYFILRGIIVSLRCSDPFGTLTGVGIMGLIAIQAFINIGGVTNTIPITGVTLPFISYGGSSLLVMMLSMGIVLSISRDSNRPMKEEQVKSVIKKDYRATR
ncbi:cell division protein FtsW [Paenibacillus sp. LC231]|uniref:putative lipid II flippase FtsW n=1 Tax=unclassified Paenibacillus TaxID=185978 RepID=UPI0008DE9481|nr:MULTISPECIES: putative lipid II flippase FtsW [unclassified Paenibacillus]MCT1397649.1 putative lipid II flippase FtsW [Paenibacillus sp. p3-SID867]OIA98853.1 cell division protein FtsW [Paenibacillus sp. LC231]